MYCWIFSIRHFAFGIFLSFVVVVVVVLFVVVLFALCCCCRLFFFLFSTSCFSLVFERISLSTKEMEFPLFLLFFFFSVCIVPYLFQISKQSARVAGWGREEGEGCSIQSPNTSVAFYECS